MLFIMAAVAYLLGSIPTGYIFAKALKGIDIRQHGSGNFGATNVYRVVGHASGIVVLILDAIKGIIPVTLFADILLNQSLGLDPILVRIVLAAAAVCGHNWTIFLNFKGGKGIAVTSGALIGLSFTIPQLGMIAGLCLGVWVLTVLTTGFVSLGSILAAIALPIFAILFNQPFKLVVFTVGLCLFAVYRHKPNIRKLLRGEEKRIFKAKNH